MSKLFLDIHAVYRHQLGGYKNIAAFVDFNQAVELARNVYKTIQVGDIELINTTDTHEMEFYNTSGILVVYIHKIRVGGFEKLFKEIPIIVLEVAINALSGDPIAIDLIQDALKI